ncbi:MAG: hypothetical protein V1872_13255 [bacterium]
MKSVHLSKYFPFNHMQYREKIIIPQPGEIFKESFESRWGQKKWSLWIEKGKVTKEYINSGIDNSKCLFISNNSKKNGVISIMP